MFSADRNVSLTSHRHISFRQMIAHILHALGNATIQTLLNEHNWEIEERECSLQRRPIYYTQCVMIELLEAALYNTFGHLPILA